MSYARSQGRRALSEAITRRRCSASGIRASESHMENKSYMEDFRRSYGIPAPAAETNESSGGVLLPSIGGRRRYSSIRQPRRGISLSSQVVNGLAPAAVHCHGWLKGPADPAGELHDLSDRNLLCCSINESEAVIGGADHSLHTVNLSDNQPSGSSYRARDAGHRDWVTGVVHTRRGTVVSTGMDGQVCHWSSSSRGDCRQVRGHSGSVAVLRGDMDGHIVTGGYDGDIKVWDCSQPNRLNMQCNLTAAAEPQLSSIPVLDLSWHDSTLCSGHRDGQLGWWDVSSGELLHASKAHRGHATVVAHSLDGPSPMFLSGGQDGCVKVWDEKSPSACALSIAPHRSKEGVGAVGGILCLGNNIISYGADMAIAVMDIRAVGQGGRAIQHKVTHHRDYIYAMASVGHTLLTGDGAGMVLVHDLAAGTSLKYGMGCCNGAVRCIATTDTQLVVAGDDGNALVYNFS